MPRYKAIDPYYMASNANKTGPIERSIKKAALGYFKQYPNENKCWVSEGVRTGNVFIAAFRGQQAEVDREMVGC
jgi:hypothetical protein